MNWVLVAGVAVAGGVGSVLRYAAGSAFPAAPPGRFSWGTVLVNVTGSFALGLVCGLGARWLPAEWVTVLGVGLLGGYTTFSAASLETAELLGRRRFFLAAASGLGVCAICLAAAAAALALAGP